MSCNGKANENEMVLVNHEAELERILQEEDERKRAVKRAYAERNKDRIKEYHKGGDMHRIGRRSSKSPQLTTTQTKIARMRKQFARSVERHILIRIRKDMKKASSTKQINKYEFIT
jgi:hypothetical protein